MGRHRIDGPGVIGFIAAATVILAVAVFLWTALPKMASAQPIMEEEFIVMEKRALIELGSKYLESIAEREALLDAVNKAHKEIHRLQSATNCS